MTEKNLIRVYTGATSEKRIDIIIKNYTKFIGIVDGYTDGLRYMIECEKESSHRQSAGDLGVRVDRKSTRLNSSHSSQSRMPSSA